MSKPSLADYTLQVLITIATSFLKPAQGLAYSFVGMLPMEEQVLYKEFITVTRNAYNLNKKSIQVFSKTPTGNDWVTYVIAYQRTVNLLSYCAYFKNNVPVTTQIKNFGWVQRLTGVNYYDETYLKQQAYARYIMGIGNPEIYDYSTGSVVNNTNISF